MDIKFEFTPEMIIPEGNNLTPLTRNEKDKIIDEIKTKIINSRAFNKISATVFIDRMAETHFRPRMVCHPPNEEKSDQFLDLLS